MGQLVLPMAFVLAFLAVATLVQVGIGAVLASRTRTQRVNRRLTMLQSGMEHRAVYEALVRQRKAPRIEHARLLSLYNWGMRFLAQANLRVSPVVLLAIWLGTAFVLWLIATTVVRAFGGAMGPPEMLASLSAAVGMTGNVMWIWLTARRRKQMKILEEQLPLALDIVIRSLRAGHPVTSALQLVTSEMGDPVGSEFGLIVDETTYGFELREALSNFARRTGSDDAHFFAVSVAIQAETGGNLSEILENLAKVIRARITLGKRVKALSSEGRMSAMILSGLPILLIMTMLLTQPSFYLDKVGDPIFWPTAGGVLCLYMSGLMMMHRIANFKY